jgi:threonine dehydrogenase-like Zn-dependent dehydrogenase
MARARSFWVTGPSKGEIREEDLREPGHDEIVVETLFSAVSRGTESLVWAGRVPASEYQRMRAPHQAGEFPFPVKYGYQSVGRAGGRLVFCLYPHQSRYVVPATDVVPLPDGIPPERAVLAANVETALNGLWDAELRLGDRVAVVGGGVVGALVAYLAGRVPGCQVELVDTDESRARIAAALGVGFARPERARADADLVVHASGSPSGLAVALGLAGLSSTVLELSWYGDRTVEAALGGAFHARRLTLRSSQVGGLPPAQQARWTLRRRLELAVSLCGDPALDVLIGADSPFDDLPELCATGAAPGHRLRYIS